MAPACLTVLLPIHPGQEDALQQILRSTGDDIKGRQAIAHGVPRIDFLRTTQTHFARLAVLNDPDRGPDRARLLFASAYDGALDEHLAEILAATSDPDAIWGKCEGYPGPAGFAAFMRAHAHEPAAFYVAFRDETVRSITRALEPRRAQSPNPRPGPPPAPLPFPLRVILFLRQALRAAPIVIDVVRAIARHGFLRVYRGTLRLIASLGRYPIFHLANQITGNRMPAMQHHHSSLPVDRCAGPAPLAPGDEVASRAASPGYREDVVVQNQLTLVTVIRHGETERVRAVMSAIDSYARRLSPPGSLIGISTIHFVRWLVIDNGRRLMMVSDYDGSWENYIDEFAEMIASGLDAIWETAIGLPPDGARDLPAFKRFLRTHQVPSDAFYSAYPDATVLNIQSETQRLEARRA